MNGNALFSEGHMVSHALQKSQPLVLEIARKQTETPWQKLSLEDRLTILLGAMATLRGVVVSPLWLTSFSAALSREPFDKVAAALDYFARLPRREYETGLPSLGDLLDKIHGRGQFQVIQHTRVRTISDLKRENHQQ